MTGPTDRPPAVLRVFAALLGVAAPMFNAALMLSDRAPSVMRRLGGDFIRRLSARIDAGGRASDVLTDPRLPESDTAIRGTVPPPRLTVTYVSTFSVVIPRVS